MKKLTAILCLTIAVLLGSLGVSWSADLQRAWMLPIGVISLQLCGNGDLLQNRGMPVPRTTWVLCMYTEKVFYRIMFVPICGSILPHHLGGVRTHLKAETTLQKR